MHFRILIFACSVFSSIVLSSGFFLLKEKIFCKKVCPLYCSPKKEKHHEHDIWSSWHPHPEHHYHYHRHEYYWHEDGPYFYEDAEYHPDFEHHPEVHHPEPKYTWKPPPTTPATTTMATTMATTEEPSGICLICRKKCYPWWEWDKSPWWDK